MKKSDIFEQDFSIKKICKETYFLWTLNNVTAQKNMEQIFENERKKLHEFILNMPVGLYIADDTLFDGLKLPKQLDKETLKNLPVAYNM